MQVSYLDFLQQCHAYFWPFVFICIYILETIYQFHEKLCWGFPWTCTKSIDPLGENETVMILSVLNYEHILKIYLDLAYLPIPFYTFLSRGFGNLSLDRLLSLILVIIINNCNSLLLVCINVIYFWILIQWSCQTIFFYSKRGS